MVHLGLRTISVKQANDSVGRDNKHRMDLKLNTHKYSVTQ